MIEHWQQQEVFICFMTKADNYQGLTFYRAPIGQVMTKPLPGEAWCNVLINSIWKAIFIRRIASDQVPS